MNILEYERRVKKYVSTESRGFVSDVQLIAAFSDTNIFQHMLDQSSVKTRFILSPYISCFSSGSKLKKQRGLIR